VTTTSGCDSLGEKKLACDMDAILKDIILT
jgi:hypothetical protein